MGRRPTLFQYLSDPDAYPSVTFRPDPVVPVRPQAVPRPPPRRMLGPGEGGNPFPSTVPDPQQPPRHIPFASLTMPQTAPAPEQDIEAFLRATQPYAQPMSELLAQTDAPMGYDPRFSPPPPDAEKPYRPPLDLSAEWHRARVRAGTTRPLPRHRPPRRPGDDRR